MISTQIARDLVYLKEMGDPVANAENPNKIKSPNLNRGKEDITTGRMVQSAQNNMENPNNPQDAPSKALYGNNPTRNIGKTSNVQN